MGIPEFYGNYLRSRKGIVIQSLPEGKKVYSLAIDLPGILHGAAQQVWAYRERMDHAEKKKIVDSLLATNESFQINKYFNLITSKIEELVANFQPKLLIIAADGEAPIAKIQEQRKRRYASKQQMDPEVLLRFDNAAISPGTELMRQFDDYLQSWIVTSQVPAKRELYSNKRGKYTAHVSILPAHVLYSSYREPGEAEQKIMNFYRKEDFTVLTGNEEVGLNILYGKDADLVLLSLVSPTNNIIVCREDYDDLVNIEEFKRSLQSVGISLYDFIIMMVFIGNDFVPRQPTMRFLKTEIVKRERQRPDIKTGKVEKVMEDYELTGAIDYIIEKYKEVKTLSAISEQYDDENDNSLLFNYESVSINWRNMFELLTALINNSSKIYEAMIDKANNIGKPTSEIRSPNITNQLIPRCMSYKDGKRIFSKKKFKELWYQEALMPRNKNILKTEMTLDFTSEDIDNMSFQYFTVVSWVLGYYLGYNVKREIYYGYHYAPLLEDLHDYLSRGIENSEVLEAISDVYLFDQPILEYNLLHQLLAILHPDSKFLIPEPLRALMNPTSNISDQFPTKIYINTDVFGSKIMPFANMANIVYEATPIMNKMSLSNWSVVDSKLYKYETQLNTMIIRGDNYYRLRKVSSSSATEDEDKAILQYRRSRGGRGDRGGGRGDRGGGRGDRGGGRGDRGGRGRGGDRGGDRGRGGRGRGRGGDRGGVRGGDRGRGTNIPHSSKEFEETLQDEQ